MEMAKETCSCGASIVVESLTSSGVDYRLAAWRQDHHHKMQAKRRPRKKPASVEPKGGQGA